MRYPYLLFDLDGTLIDTNELILRSFEHAFEIHKPNTYTREDILQHMGRPLREQMELFVPGKADELVETYRAFNIEQHDSLVVPFPSVQDVIRELHEAGCKMAIVTSKMRYTTQKGLDLCQLTPYFEVVVTADDTQKHKPDPEPLRKAMAALGAEPSRTLMVGDSPFDIQAGKAAGVATAGVKWSLRGEEGLMPYEPDYLVADMRELASVILGPTYR
jgi:pyrophosphatase PpaX